eukprot:29550-Eustigmatos_ZCMA.PRE.1
MFSYHGVSCQQISLRADDELIHKLPASAGRGEDTAINRVRERVSCPPCQLKVSESAILAMMH